MKIQTAVYRQNGGSRTSVLVQQVTRKKDALGITLACVCTVEAGERPMKASPKTSQKEKTSKRGNLCERLLYSFREDILVKNVDSMAECRKTIEKILPDEAGISGSVSNPIYDFTSYSGMLCIGSEVLLFAAGRQRIYLINTAFMRPQLCLLLGENTAGPFHEQHIHGRQLDTHSPACLYTPRTEWAQIERGAAVLLATEPFYEHMNETYIRECLFVKGDRDGTRTERHLGEYGRYMESLGGKDMAAVIVSSR